jgi:hypothetical protein
MNGQYMRRRGDDAEMGADVEIATAEDVRAAWQRVVDDTGCSFAELKAQARNNDFESMYHQLAWVAFGDLGDLLDDRP